MSDRYDIASKELLKLPCPFCGSTKRELYQDGSKLILKCHNTKHVTVYE